MTKHLQTLVFITAFSLIFAAVGRAQQPSAPQPAKAATVQPEQPPVLTPLRLQIVISRYQGDKKISSLPYTLSVNANDGRRRGDEWVPNGVSLRMGAKVPVPQGVIGDKTASYTFQDVGTNIDCSATTIDGGRFRVDVRIEDSSVYTDSQNNQAASRLSDIPTFRTFRVNNVLLLKDGQSNQFTAATDKVSGEVVKIDVTLTVVK